MQHPELPTFAFISALLVLVPLPWHWRARNVATLAIIFWLFVVDVIYGVNAIVWAGNVRNPIPVWCDISAFFSVYFVQPFLISDLCSHQDYCWSIIRPSSCDPLHLQTSRDGLFFP